MTCSLKSFLQFRCEPLYLKRQITKNDGNNKNSTLQALPYFNLTYKIYTHTQSTKGLKFYTIWFRTYLQSTPYNTNPNNLNLSLTRNNFHFPSDSFYIILPSITRTLKDSNLFLLPLKVRISGSRPYIAYFKRK